MPNTAAPNNGRAPAKPKPRPKVHPHFVEALVQIVGVVIVDGVARKVMSPVTTIPRAEWPEFSTGAVADFEAQTVEP